MTVDPNTGQVVVSQVRGAPAAITVSRVVTCPGGSLPSSVSLRHGAGTFPMTEEPPGSKNYVGTIPAASRVDGAEIIVVPTCGSEEQPVVVGKVQLYDPSGVVTNATTGQPVPNAQVLLFRIPGWRPDTDGGVA